MAWAATIIRNAGWTVDATRTRPWAQDYNPNRAATAVFHHCLETPLWPTAHGNPDGALVSAGAEMKWLNGFSLATTFEGEFSGNTTSYAGKAVAKYGW